MHNKQKIEWKESMKICAAHFNKVSFTESGHLLEDAKPTIFGDPVIRRKSELYVMRQVFLFCKKLIRLYFCSKSSEKQQLQPKHLQQNTIKSINVPLHRANAENQSMIRRITPASIMNRRLSLPYSRLPKLLPKPDIVKAAPSPQTNALNGGLINVHRIGHQNLFATASSSSHSASSASTVTNTPKATLRPLPGLTKVVSKVGNLSKLVLTNGQQHSAKKNFVMIRKSMRPPQPPLSTSLNTTKAIKTIKLLSSTAGWAPVKSAQQIARMPPALTPAPRSAKLPVKTYSKNGLFGMSKLPIISQVQSIMPDDGDNHDRLMPTAVTRTNSAGASTTVQTLRPKTS